MPKASPRSRDSTQRQPHRVSDVFGQTGHGGSKRDRQQSPFMVRSQVSAQHVEQRLTQAAGAFCRQTICSEPMPGL
jgi:hypothetical protein